MGIVRSGHDRQIATKGNRMAGTRTIAGKLPWNDKAGCFSPLKASVLVLVCLPMLWLICRATLLGLGARPITEAIHRVGGWTVYLLLITLAVTPARRLFYLPKLILVRRILGLSALAYILAHFLLFVLDSKFDLVFVTKEILLRIYLTIGFVAILGLIALGVTSTDGMIRRLGGRHWNRLHKLIYFITPLAILHFYMQSKADVSQPVIMSGFYFWLMGYRIMARYGYKDGLVPLAILSLAAAVLTAVVEATWYQLMTGIGGSRVLAANYTFDFGLRPATWVLGAGLTMTLAAELSRRLRPGQSGRRQPAMA
jgi:sulfoxide reductase heme-binding subunit YedZ